MAVLEVQCKNQSLEWVKDPDEMYAGNIKIDSVAFNFCELWDGFTKTAVFYRDKNNAFKKMLDDTNACEIPPELTEEKGLVYIGVFGIKGECRRTTAVKSFYLKEGILTDGKPSEPTPDIYQQIINLYAEAKETATRAETTAKDAEEKAQNALAVANSVRADADNGKFNGATLKGYELISDITITEDVESVVWERDKDGNALSKYKSLLIYFVGKFTASGNEVLMCRGDNGAYYFMYKQFAKTADKWCGLWVEIDEICMSDVFSGFKTTYPQNLLRNYAREGVATQGLTDNNSPVYSDFTARESLTYLTKLHIDCKAGSNGLFAAGSKFLIFGKER